ncbi:hypothetical protein HOLleu_03553 [Holothuria leucospilota]|uniref:Uncharacterized protein n=1 Tax=Holothuria leucospilota TaxID=206669 RepID=A0A9Q1HLE6_HOLLE|nr:hypothetical protein HOLleu_03553 [Holothuria leucospilota]
MCFGSVALWPSSGSSFKCWLIASRFVTPGRSARTTLCMVCHPRHAIQVLAGYLPLFRPP